MRLRFRRLHGVQRRTQAIKDIEKAIIASDLLPRFACWAHRPTRLYRAYALLKSPGLLVFSVKFSRTFDTICKNSPFVQYVIHSTQLEGVYITYAFLRFHYAFPKGSKVA